MIAPLLTTHQLCCWYGRGRDLLGRKKPVNAALTDVTLSVEAGETLGVLGESGSGKSTLARCLVGLQPPTAGHLWLDGEAVLPLDAKRRRALARAVQLVFQDPRGSLNPKHRVGHVLDHALGGHAPRGRSERKLRVAQCLREVGLEDSFAHRLPGALSGGQAQRVAIARALARMPRLLILDEALASLDSATRREMIALLRELQRARGLAYMFISHDVPLVGELCDRIAVMRAGRVVELGSRDDVLCAPGEAYTRTLLDAVPRLP